MNNQINPCEGKPSDWQQVVVDGEAACLAPPVQIDRTPQPTAETAVPKQVPEQLPHTGNYTGTLAITGLALVATGIAMHRKADRISQRFSRSVKT